MFKFAINRHKLFPTCLPLFLTPEGVPMTASWFLNHLRTNFSSMQSSPKSVLRLISIYAIGKCIEICLGRHLNPASSGSSLSTPLAGTSFSLVRLTHAIGRHFQTCLGRHIIQPRQAHSCHWQAFYSALSGSLTPLAGISEHALAGISILRLVSHSSSCLDARSGAAPSSSDLSPAIHASSGITQFSLSLASTLLGKTYLIIILRCLFKATSSSAFTSSSGVREPKK
ncbi:hypothetical protein ILYODFUR_027297 [Ilyodon furcidens]|uniref:Uncharacterized protein n=1 Tax=Ilyodon furcidens TaxID=33524 RepID=A0ABV0V7H6_9TELE